MRLKSSTVLLAIVMAAAVTRVFTIWIGRAEFTGWFNHTYYYFVQVRGLVEGGSLPYPDMPLLFFVDAVVARGLVGIGLDLDAAVVAATRLTMCVVPALIPLPVYGIVKGLNGPDPIRRKQWALIALAGFVPLSTSYLPEVLQKNMLGLLLLSILILSSQRLLARRELGDAIVSVIVALAIVLTHYGSFAAMMLYGTALVLAVSVVQRAPRRTLLLVLGLASGGALGVALIAALDAQRYHRLLAYARDSLSHSLVAEVAYPTAGRVQALVSLAVILLFYSLLLGAHTISSRSMSTRPTADQTLFLANVIFSGLLVLPLLDQLLMGRLALFASVPLLIVIIHVESYATVRPRWKAAGVALLVAFVAALTFGELISARIHNANQEEILVDLEELRLRHPFGPDDLVVARTGVDHVCNWFYGVRAGVITSLTLDDFERYENVFVLNPLDGTSSSGSGEGRNADTEADRYRIMRSNIPKPRDLAPLFVTDNLELFRLEGPPTEWQFGPDGRFLSYSPSALPSPRPQ